MWLERLRIVKSGSRDQSADGPRRPPNQPARPTPWSHPGRKHGFLWQDGVITGLGTLGGPYSFAVAINERGQVVGSRKTEAALQAPWHAFLWQDGVSDLGTLGGASRDCAADDQGKTLLLFLRAQSPPGAPLSYPPARSASRAGHPPRYLASSIQPDQTNSSPTCMLVGSGKYQKLW